MDIDQILEDSVANRDPERLESLRTLFREGGAPASPFSAALHLDPDAAREAGLPYEGAAESQPPGALAARIEEARSSIAFDLKTGGGFEGLRLVAEGDSWLTYPVVLKAIAEQLAEEPDLAVFARAAAGDTMADWAARSDLAQKVTELSADAVLLSGGGNDLLARAPLAALLFPYSDGATAEALLDGAALSARLAEVVAGYRQIMSQLLAARPGLVVLAHGYDHFLPREDGPWLGAVLAEKGIPPDLGREVIALVVDRLATALQELAAAVPGFYPVDLRGAIGTSLNSWHDEVHPRNAGFARAAERVHYALRQALGARPQARMVIPEEPAPVPFDPEDPEPLSATTFSETPATPAPVPFEPLVPFSSFADRTRMAHEILNYEARRVNGKLAVYHLPAGDGGGTYEVAGINDRYHKTEVDHLVALIEAGRHAEAEAYATEFIAGYTDRADRWCATLAVEFYVRDCVFNRGPGGAAWILQHAVGAETDMSVGQKTRDAVAVAERNPARLVDKLRASREVYERHIGRDERSRFWQGLVNRWNKAQAFARTLLPPAPQAVAVAIVPRVEEEPAAAQPAQPVPALSRSAARLSRATLFQAMGDFVGIKDSVKARVGSFEGPDMATAFASGPSPEPRLNVLGVGVGEKVSEGQMTGLMSVKVYVQRKFPKALLSDAQMIAPEMDGILIDVVEIGDLRPLMLPDPRARYDVPVPGCSIGYDQMMAGTFGALVRDRFGRMHLLSNNHVLAGEDTLAVGAPIFQQGQLDQAADDAPRQVGILSQAVPLGLGNVDAALASPLDGVQLSNETLHIGPPRGVSDVFQGMELHKFGRTTRYTVGFVSDLAADVKIPYLLGGVKLYENQIGVTSMGPAPFSEPGDSGALVMSRPGNLAVGLLFAGSPATTFVNPIADVLAGLNVELSL
ncbi:GDSL-type esterase/lipase family protein [Salipiger sp. H15]|uniref:GDSL-type esterase/lipase family protein n=1 Tax=Alloyangia sp. H15 TaxID=3029062 RepID=A0AAU8ANV6_9RHOB